MAKQIIDLGTPPKGTDGDTSRVAFEKARDNFDELYARVQSKLERNVDGAGTVALTAEEASNGFIDLTGVLTGDRIVSVPGDPPQMYVVRNRTTGNFSLTFQGASGSGVVVPKGKPMWLVSDGTDVTDGQTYNPGRLIGVRVFTSSGTYTETPGTKSVIVEIQGAGGAGGGAPLITAGQGAAGGCGGAGGYVRHRMTSGFSGAAVLIGSPGVGVAGTFGGNGGDSSFAGIVAGGGRGGGISSANTSLTTAGGGSGGTAAVGSILRIPGGNGPLVTGNASSIIFVPQAAPAGYLGAIASPANMVTNGNPGLGYGSGGGGTFNLSGFGGGAALVGGAGAPGVVIVWEYS